MQTGREGWGTLQMTGKWVTASLGAGFALCMKPCPLWISELREVLDLEMHTEASCLVMYFK